MFAIKNILRSLAVLGFLLGSDKTYAEESLKAAFASSFKVGVALSNRDVLAPEGEAVKQIIKLHYNAATPENEMKWDAIHPRKGPDGYDFTKGDQFVKLALCRNMDPAGHTLVWHSQMPPWLSSLSPTEYLPTLKEHIAAVVGHYKGQVKIWDVVNEVISDKESETLRSESPWLKNIGENYVAEAFNEARKADPSAVLRINDYSLEYDGKRKRFIEFVKKLLAQNVPVTAIGTQSHFISNVTFEQVDKELTELETLGLPIYVTELDLKGADPVTYGAVFRAFVKHAKSIESVTFWGVTDANSWLKEFTPLIFDASGKPKPAFDAVIKTATVGGGP